MHTAATTVFQVALFLISSFMKQNCLDRGGCSSEHPLSTSEVDAAPPWNMKVQWEMVGMRSSGLSSHIFCELLLLFNLFGYWLTFELIKACCNFTVDLPSLPWSCW